MITTNYSCPNWASSALERPRTLGWRRAAEPHVGDEPIPGFRALEPRGVLLYGQYASYAARLEHDGQV